MDSSAVVDILLVEDNPNDAELTIRAMRKHNIVNPLHVVEDGAEALDFVFCRGAYAEREGSRPPRVILLDLKLPKLDGLAVLKAVKTNERTCSIPVVVLTSSQEDADIKAAYALDANSYVVKPVVFESFMDVIGSLGRYWLTMNQSPDAQEI